MESNFNLMHRSVCRLEIVLSLPNIVTEIHCTHYKSKANIRNLLEGRAVLVPFVYNFFGNQFFRCIRKLGIHLCEKLGHLNNVYANTGNCSATWSAFQLELALGKLLCGHPLGFMSQQSSINLGPGVSYPSRSLSDHLGFLALGDSNAMTDSENSCPPTKIWTSSTIIQQRIEKIVGFHDYLCGNHAVVGRSNLHFITGFV